MSATLRNSSRLLAHRRGCSCRGFASRRPLLYILQSRGCRVFRRLKRDHPQELYNIQKIKDDLTRKDEKARRHHHDHHDWLFDPHSWGGWKVGRWWVHLMDDAPIKKEIGKSFSWITSTATSIHDDKQQSNSRTNDRVQMAKPIEEEEEQNPIDPITNRRVPRKPNDKPPVPRESFGWDEMLTDVATRNETAISTTTPEAEVASINQNIPPSSESSNRGTDRAKLDRLAWESLDTEWPYATKTIFCDESLGAREKKVSVDELESSSDGLAKRWDRLLAGAQEAIQGVQEQAREQEKSVRAKEKEKENKRLKEINAQKEKERGKKEAERIKEKEKEMEKEREEEEKAREKKLRKEKEKEKKAKKDKPATRTGLNMSLDFNDVPVPSTASEPLVIPKDEPVGIKDLVSDADEYSETPHSMDMSGEVAGQDLEEAEAAPDPEETLPVMETVKPKAKTASPISKAGVSNSRVNEADMATDFAFEPVVPTPIATAPNEDPLAPSPEKKPDTLPRKRSTSRLRTVKPTIYKILAFDDTTQKVTMAETASAAVEVNAPPSPAEVLIKLSHPAKFFPHFAELQAQGFEILSGAGDVLVFRKVREGVPMEGEDGGGGGGGVPTKTLPSAGVEDVMGNAVKHATDTSEATTSSSSSSSSSSSTTASRKINPIDLMGNFASPTGFVNYRLYDVSKPEVDEKPPPPFRDEGLAEPVKSEYVAAGTVAAQTAATETATAATAAATTAKKPETKTKNGPGKISRMVMAGLGMGGALYVMGTVGEYL